MWWKFKGGKSAGNDAVAWWKKHRDLYARVEEMLNVNVKEICMGEVTEDDIFSCC